MSIMLPLQQKIFSDQKTKNFQNSDIGSIGPWYNGYGTQIAIKRSM